MSVEGRGVFALNCLRLFTRATYFRMLVQGVDLLMLRARVYSNEDDNCRSYALRLVLCRTDLIQHCILQVLCRATTAPEVHPRRLRLWRGVEVLQTTLPYTLCRADPKQAEPPAGSS